MEFDLQKKMRERERARKEKKRVWFKFRDNRKKKQKVENIWIFKCMLGKNHFPSSITPPQSASRKVEKNMGTVVVAIKTEGCKTDKNATSSKPPNKKTPKFKGSKKSQKKGRGKMGSVLEKEAKNPAMLTDGQSFVQTKTTQKFKGRNIFEKKRRRETFIFQIPF